MPIPKTHDDIAEFGAKWLRSNGYKLAWSNMRSADVGEQPDVMAVKSIHEITVMEVKVSRSDFLSDKKKPWRKEPGKGIGTVRIYLTPEGLLKPSEIPYGWLLYEVFGKNSPRMRIVKGIKMVNATKEYNGHTFTGRATKYLNIDNDEFNHFSRSNQNVYSVIQWLTQILIRMKQCNLEPEKFGNGDHLKKVLGIKTTFEAK